MGSEEGGEGEGESADSWGHSITQAHQKSDRKKFLWGTDHGTDHDFGGPLFPS